MVTLKGTVVRVKGVGLIVQEHTKNGASMRTIPPPSWVFDILKRRHAASQSPWVFPNTLGKLRDPDNTRKHVRKVVANTRFMGLHPHGFRHYVADVLEKAGLTARQIADYLGHDRIRTTQQEYMERGVVGHEAAAAMAAQPEPEEGQK